MQVIDLPDYGPGAPGRRSRRGTGPSWIRGVRCEWTRRKRRRTPATKKKEEGEEEGDEEEGDEGRRGRRRRRRRRRATKGRRREGWRGRGRLGGEGGGSRRAWGRPSRARRHRPDAREDRERCQNASSTSTRHEDLSTHSLRLITGRRGEEVAEQVGLGILGYAAQPLDPRVLHRRRLQGSNPRRRDSPLVKHGRVVVKHRLGTRQLGRRPSNRGCIPRTRPPRATRKRSPTSVAASNAASAVVGDACVTSVLRAAATDSTSPSCVAAAREAAATTSRLRLCPSSSAPFRVPFPAPFRVPSDVTFGVSSGRARRPGALRASSSSSSSSARAERPTTVFYRPFLFFPRLATRLTRVASVAPGRAAVSLADLPACVASSPRPRFFPRPTWRTIFRIAVSLSRVLSRGVGPPGVGTLPGLAVPSSRRPNPPPRATPGKVVSGCFTHASRARTKASRLRPRRWKKTSR